MQNWTHDRKRSITLPPSRETTHIAESDVVAGDAAASVPAAALTAAPLRRSRGFSVCKYDPTRSTGSARSGAQPTRFGPLGKRMVRLRRCSLRVGCTGVPGVEIESESGDECSPDAFESRRDAARSRRDSTERSWTCKAAFVPMRRPKSSGTLHPRGTSIGGSDAPSRVH